MSNKVATADLYPVIADVVASGGSFDFIPGGTSMLPTLNGSSDVVTLCKAESVQKGDIILFKRDNGQFILHRVIAVSGDELTVRGDNVYGAESVMLTDVLAKVSRYTTAKGECTDVIGGLLRAQLHRPIVIIRAVITKINNKPK